MNNFLDALLCGAGTAAFVQYVDDCCHVYHVLETRQGELGDGSQVTEQQVEEVLDYYLGTAGVTPSGKNTTITKEEFLKGLEDLQGKLKRKGRQQKHGLAPPVPDQSSYAILRESVAFLGGGRAALLQLAHPYIAAGIAQHSNLKFGIQQRFFNTFKHIFNMTFGELDEVMKSAHVVRRLHDKVHGTIDDDVGVFEQGSRYDANNAHALWWVQATLIETSILMYEMMVRKLSEAERDRFVQDSHEVGALFGVPPELQADTWKRFMHQYVLMLKSGVIAVSKDAKDISKFIWKPQHGAVDFSTLLKSVEWGSAVMLPPQVSLGFYGRKITKLDMFAWSLLNGYVRFVYRLLPPSLRWLTPYFLLEVRLGKKFTVLQKAMMEWSSMIANKFLDLAMPDRE